MSRERDEFIAIMVREMPNMPPSQVIDFARKVMRLAHTHHRLSEACCNGDWPADNGERKTKECVRCEYLWHPSTISRDGLCKSCRAEDTITKHCKPFGITPDFQGDPRGATVKLKVPSGYTNDWGKIGICVPQ